MPVFIRILPTCFVFLVTLPCSAQPGGHSRGQDRSLRTRDHRQPLQAYSNVVSVQGAVGKLGPFVSAAGGLMYERFFGAQRRFSFTVPVSAYTGSATFKGVSDEPPWVHVSGHTVGAGLHYHLFTPNRVLDFSLGLTSDIGQASGSIHKPDGRSIIAPTKRFRETYAAMALQPALNFHTRNRLQASVFGNLGYVISGIGPYHPYAGNPDRLLVQVGIRMGVGF